MIRNKRGITLIALIITIVVLLILAGVVINLTMGDNGIIGKVQTAVGKYENAIHKENMDIEKMIKEIGSQVGGSREQIMVDKDEYETLKATVSSMATRVNQLTDTKLNNNTNLLISNRYRAGTVTMGAVTPENRGTSVNVSFSEPFPNTNYSVSVLQANSGEGAAAMSYYIDNKTVSGFRIYTYSIFANTSREAHSVDWIAVADNN